MPYQPDPYHLCGCVKSVSHQCENEGRNKGGNEGIREGDGHPNQNKATYIIEVFHVHRAYFIFNGHNLSA